MPERGVATRPSPFLLCTGANRALPAGEQAQTFTGVVRKPVELRYLVWTPDPAARPAAGCPLLIFLHGYYPANPPYERWWSIAERHNGVAERHGHTLAQLALAWALRDPAMTSAIAGARSPKQIQETVAAGNVDLPPAVIAEIELLLQA